MMLALGHRSYLGAVVLNNSAVTLLERGRYRQAMSLLQDSIYAMKNVTLNPMKHDWKENRGAAQNNVTAVQGEETLADIEAMLQNATRIMAESDPFTQTHLKYMSAVESQVFGVDGPQVQLKLPDVPSTTYVLPVRIETTLALHGDTDFESVIILYNFAVANLLGSAGENSNANELLRNAMTMATLSSKIVSRLFYMDGVSTSTSNREVLLQLSLLILHCVYQIHLSLGEESEASRVFLLYKLVRPELGNSPSSISLAVAA